ncbi:hypothetical protein GE21DRAFT_1347330, partial [Neurospora crassa]
MKTDTRRQPSVPALPGGGRPGSIGSRGDINPLSAVIDAVPIACLVDVLMRYGKHDTRHAISRSITEGYSLLG